MTKAKNIQKEIGWLLKEKFGGKPTAGFEKDVKRLEAGEPVDYVIGFTEFLGCKIDLSQKPLIPRQDTAYWVERAIETMHHNSCGRVKCDVRVLDIFAGSGCIGIAVLAHIKNSLCDFAEKDLKALKQIKINLKNNQPSPKALAWRSKIINSDVFSNISGKYDYILANPPYVARNRINKVRKSVLQFEPKVALFGGEDGLFYIKKLLSKAKEHLNPGGVIFIEFDGSQKKEIETLIKKYNYSKYQFHRDQSNRWRWVVVG